MRVEALAGVSEKYARRVLVEREGLMSTREAREKAAAETLTSTVRRAGQTHERALLVELWAAEYFQRRGDVEAAQRHRDAAERQGTLAEDCYGRL
jgi:hypothetical protein